MSPIALHVMRSDEITSEMVATAARIFSENYGVWGDAKRVKMGPKTLRAMILPVGAENFYIQALDGNVLVGNVFACRWMVENRQICWITQLVVKRDYRRQGIATKLLHKLREGSPQDCCFGVLSSHPAAIRAALRIFGKGLENVELESTKIKAATVMASAPIDYIRSAILHGSLFDGEVTDGSVSCAFTDFFVDHKEPLEALQQVQKDGIVWPFGELPEGHEFLVLI